MAPSKSRSLAEKNLVTGGFTLASVWAASLAGVAAILVFLFILVSW
jgi:hypothetical protein